LAEHEIFDSFSPRIGIIDPNSADRQSLSVAILLLDTVAVIDASNVARNGSKGKLSRLINMMDELSRIGIKYVCIADASLRHRVDDVETYEKMIDDGTIAQAPAKSSADAFITRTAEKLSSMKVKPFVVTNDLELAQSKYFVGNIKFMFFPWDGKELLILDPAPEDLLSRMWKA
jgi:hypothetical protein